jgi:formyl-CoA transferase
MAPESAQSRALTGIRVLDLGQMYSGSYCGLLLAQLGAEVIKVEPPQGESLRWRNEDGLSKPFLMLNSNKHGIAIDLKQDTGRELLLDLAAECDVLIENFRYGVMQTLRLDYAEVSARNPRIVYASGTGYGANSPLRDVPAMDITIQASSGVMAATGDTDGPPMKAGVALADFLAGVHLAAAILAALVQRQESGRGQHVEVSMQDALLPTLTSNFAGLFETDRAVPERTGNRHGSLSMSPYNTYPAADGWVAIFCVRDVHWAEVCKAMQRPELADDPRFATRAARVEHIDEVDELITAWTSTRPRDELIALLVQYRIPAAPVRGVAEVAADASLHERGMLTTIDYPGVGDTLVYGSPLQLSDSPASGPPTPAPRLGEHTDEILAEILGLEPSRIDALRAVGAVV